MVAGGWGQFADNRPDDRWGQDGRIDPQWRFEEIDDDVGSRSDVVAFRDDTGRQTGEPVLRWVFQLAEREHVLMVDTDKRLEIRYHQFRLKLLEVLVEKLVVLSVRLGQLQEVPLERF